MLEHWTAGRRTALLLALLAGAMSARAEPGVPVQVCAECHPDVAATYRLTGMGRSFSTANAQTVGPGFDGRQYLHARSNRLYEAIERDGAFFLRRYETDASGARSNPVEQQVHYVLGSGNHARAYLHRTPDGRLLQAPVSWYAARGGYWAMAPGYDRPDHLDFRREIDAECLFCHNAYPQAEARETSGSPLRVPAELPQGVDCVRCHGPGAAHVDAARAGAEAPAVRAAILNPSRLDPERQLEVCMQCHLETTTDALPHAIRKLGRDFFSYSPAEPLADYVLHFDHAPGAGREDKFEIAGHAYRLRQSKCFQQNSGALTCTTCHDPHHAPRGEEAVEHYDRACRSCHAAAFEAKVAAGEHTAAKGCASCHMPQRPAEDALHVSMTDHLIAARPRQTPLPADDSGREYRGRVELYYPPSLPEPERTLYVAIAQVKNSANLREGAAALAGALRDSPSQYPEPYYELAEAQRKLGEPRAALHAYSQALERDATYWPALRGRGEALAATGDLDGAAASLEAAVALAPREAPLAVTLGDVYFRASRHEKAVAELRRALMLAPETPEAHNNLGVVYAAQGKRVAAEAELREALRHRPDYAEARKNLEILLADRR